jgi:hypothetical protein
MPETWNLRRRLTLSGGEIAYDVLGYGPPLILVHGTPSRSYIWRDVVLRLADRFTLYVFDLLGFGQSERREGLDVSISGQSRVLAELVRGLGARDTLCSRPRYRRRDRPAHPPARRCAPRMHRPTRQRRPPPVDNPHDQARKSAPRRLPNHVRRDLRSYRRLAPPHSDVQAAGPTRPRDLPRRVEGRVRAETLPPESCPAR